MKRKAIASILALTLTAAAALAGCGSESSEKSEGGGENPLRKKEPQSRGKKPQQMSMKTEP